MPKSIDMCEDEILPLPDQKPYVIGPTADYDQERGFCGNFTVDALKMFHTDTVRESLQPEGYRRRLTENGKGQTVGSFGRAALIFGSKDVACYTGFLTELAKMWFLFCLPDPFSKYLGEDPPFILKGTLSQPRLEDRHAR